MSSDYRRVLGFVALLLGLAATLPAPRQALTGWLAAFVLQSATVLGGLLFIMLVDVIPGIWRNIVRPPAAMLAAGMPLLAVFCLPVLFGIRLIFPWYNGEGLTGFRAFYLAPLAVAARLIVFFAICICFRRVFRERLTGPWPPPHSSFLSFSTACSPRMSCSRSIRSSIPPASDYISCQSRR